jgi:hypothetical protein
MCRLPSMAQAKIKKDTVISVKEASSPEVPEVSFPPERKPSCSRLFRYIIPAVALLFLIGNVGLFAYLKITTNQQNQKAALVPKVTPSPSPTPTPTPTPYPLPQGRQSFLVSYGNGTTGPKASQVTIDPYDPKIGQPQTFTVAVSDTSPITSVDLSLYTDTKVASYSLTRVSGTETRGNWEVKITTDDTHLYHYSPSFVVKSANGENHADLTLRAY